MARRQTRRAVSLRPASYDKVKTYCAARGISMSSFIEDRWAELVVGIVRRASDDPLPEPEPEPEHEPEPEDEPEVKTYFRPSGMPVTRLKPYKKKPVRGGGVHEF